MAVDPISASLAVASLASSVIGSKSAKDAAKKAAKEQARFVGLQRREELRKLRQQADVDIGMARAQIGASNVRFSGSAQSYTRELSNEYDRQLAYGRGAMKLEQRAIRAGAAGAGQGQLIQGLSQAVSYGIRSVLEADKPSGGAPSGGGPKPDLGMI